MIILKIRTVLALGIPNVVRALLYRTGLKLGIHPVQHIKASAPKAPFFHSVVNPPVPPGRWNKAIPDWHQNPMTGVHIANPDRPWWEIPDFDPAFGDIKTVWEASRFDWVLEFSQCNDIGRLNTWLLDWLQKNPPYRGPNWKCGQEASIRVMHLAMAALILDQAKSSSRGLLDLIEMHLKRIAPSMGYAVAQDNNHGTSEAAALFIGGSWLRLQGRPQGKKWEKLGRKWLENRVIRLVETDGSFSQYSVNYHRMLLDTLSMAEIWRRHMALDPFSAHWQQRAYAASEWLRAMVDPSSGDAPNIGGNDGARLLPLTDTDYRDFRPSVQLAAALFTSRRAYNDSGIWNAPLTLLAVRIPLTAVPPLTSKQFDDGGYAVLRRGDAMAVLRYPRFHFRPAQADALHLDFWRGSENLLRDGGSYSYADAEATAYFSGTASHNTVQFDGRDQMPRISRFLFGDWLKAELTAPGVTSGDSISYDASYRDSRGAHHQRQITLSDSRLEVRDKIEGFKDKAVLRWRLKPGSWRIDGHSISDGHYRLQIASTTPIVRFELVTGSESRYYLKRTELPVLEVEVHAPSVLTTDFGWTN